MKGKKFWKKMDDWGFCIVIFSGLGLLVIHFILIIVTLFFSYAFETIYHIQSIIMSIGLLGMLLGALLGSLGLFLSLKVNND